MLMSAKTYFSRFRCDKELKLALQASADLADRQIADQARYILRLALGLNTPEEDERIRTRLRDFKYKPYWKHKR